MAFHVYSDVVCVHHFGHVGVCHVYYFQHYVDPQALGAFLDRLGLVKEEGAALGDGNANIGFFQFVGYPGS